MIIRGYYLKQKQYSKSIKTVVKKNRKWSNEEKIVENFIKLMNLYSVNVFPKSPVICFLFYLLISK